MPISSRRIIAHINGLKRPFTQAELAEWFPAKKERARKKKGHRAPLQSSSTLDELLRALCSIGYLERRKKSYSRSPFFKIEGIIKIESRGNGVIKTPSGEEYLVGREHTNHAHNNDRVEASLLDFRQGLFHASVTGIVKRRKERYIARVEGKSKSGILFRLIDIPGGVEVCAPRMAEEPRQGDLSIVSLTGGMISGVQECRIDESFSPDEEAFDTRRIIIKHSLPDPHPEYEELDAIDASYLSREKKDRRDYRRLCTVTIDGENAKDFDDAISLEKTGDGFKLYVHIADVSAFVRKGGPLDTEAAGRGTSFYLGNHVIPMLPELLSNELCSLKEGVERLTLSVEMRFDRRGRLLDSSFHRGLIKSHKRLTYAQAHELIDGSSRKQIPSMLREMYSLALILKENRMRQGRIDLNLTDSEFVYEGNSLIDLVHVSRLKSHLIIEEFMLGANETVSRMLREQQIPTLYRIHETISDEKLAILVRFLRPLGLSFNRRVNPGMALQEIINRVRGEEYEEVINFIILKSLMQAYYGVEPLGHFGLGFRDYTHFTSPIRRYPDLVVHRCLKSIIRGETAPYTTEELAPIGEKSSEMERIAQNAERDLFRLKSCRFMAPRVGQEFDAVISGVARFGFFVTLLEKPVEGLVPLRFLTDDYYLVQEDEFTVIGRRLGRRFRLGDRLRVRLASADPATMRIDFDLAQGHSAPANQTTGRHSRRYVQKQSPR